MSAHERSKYYQQAALIRNAAMGEQRTLTGFGDRMSRRVRTALRKVVDREPCNAMAGRRCVAVLSIGAITDHMGGESSCALLAPVGLSGIRPDDAAKLDSVVIALRCALSTTLRHLMEDEALREADPPAPIVTRGHL